MGEYPIPRWFDFAHAEIGVRETPGPVATPRILEYWRAMPGWNGKGDDALPWCSAFVNWALSRCHIKGTDHPAAKSWISWGEARAARPGCIVVLKHRRGKTPITGSGYHVGFLVSVDDRFIVLLGGNQGDAVSEASFPVSRWEMLACRWPLDKDGVK